MMKRIISVSKNAGRTQSLLKVFRMRRYWSRSAVAVVGDARSGRWWKRRGSVTVSMMSGYELAMLMRLVTDVDLGHKRLVAGWEDSV